MKIMVQKPSDERGRHDVEEMTLEEAREYAEENVPDRVCKECSEGVLTEITKNGGPYLSCTSCDYGDVGKVHGRGSPLHIVDEE